MFRISQVNVSDTTFRILFRIFRVVTMPHLTLFRYKCSPSDVTTHPSVESSSMASITSDYTPIQTKVQFTTGVAQINVEIELMNNHISEEPEHFDIVLSDPVGCSLQEGLSTATVTIYDDDLDQSKYRRIHTYNSKVITILGRLNSQRLLVMCKGT